METIGFVLVISTCVPFSYALTGGNVCRLNKTQGNNTWLVHENCCKGYEEKNNKCEQIECSPGFIGSNCNTTCPDNYYGKICLSQCHCNNATHYCHHVCGCLQKSVILRNTTVTNDRTSSESVTSSYFTDTCPTTEDTRPTEALPDTRPAEQDSECHNHHNEEANSVADN